MATYSYEGLYGLSPERLFVWVVIDTTKEQLGLDDLAAAFAVVSGQPLIPVRGKLAGATKGTSVASLVMRRMINFEMPFRLPSINGNTLRTLKPVMTRHLGAWIGRTIPFVGYVFVAKDVVEISYKSVRRYNALVKPEDQITW